jgi:hypothetical protein
VFGVGFCGVPLTALKRARRPQQPGLIADRTVIVNESILLFGSFVAPRVKYMARTNAIAPAGRTRRSASDDMPDLLVR